MEIEEFVELVESARRRNPVWFGLPSDEAASNEEIQCAEQALGVRFPREYVEFVKRYGGGYFAFVNVYSVTETSEWYIVFKNRSIGINARRYLAISENGAGDYFGFRVDNASCFSEIVFWDHETEEVRPTEFKNFLDFVARVGLKAAF